MKEFNSETIVYCNNQTNMNKAIFLDRDGTINIDKNYIFKIEDFEFIPGAIQGLKLMQEAGFKLIIITNQSGIARGYYSVDDYEKLNEWIIINLATYGVKIDAVYYCPHHPEGKIDEYSIKCNCRKPNLGLFEKAINELNIDLDNSYAIGDKIRDLSICNHSKVKGIILCNRNEEKELFFDKKIKVTSNLLDAANIIINNQFDI